MKLCSACDLVSSIWLEVTATPVLSWGWFEVVFAPVGSWQQLDPNATMEVVAIRDDRTEFLLAADVAWNAGSIVVDTNAVPVGFNRFVVRKSDADQHEIGGASFQFWLN